MKTVSITAIVQAAGKGGDTITIKGANFGAVAADNLVLFHTDTAAIHFASADSLIVIAPVHGTTGLVSVTVAGETAIGPVFTYLADTSDNTPVEDSVDIYATGYDNDVVYWKNGTEYLLTHLVTASYSSGYALVLDDTDVYIAGTHNNEGKYWKNGVETLLTDANSQNGEARTLIKSGSDIYIGGSDRNLPVYWKNEAEIPLSSSQGIVNGIAVNLGDVHAVGQESGIAVLWKNDNRMQLGDTVSTDIGASGIAFSGNDILVCGAESGNAVLWKNGVKMILATPANQIASVAYAIAIVGNNTFVVGTDGVNAVYWLNGSEVKLPKSGFNAAATAIAFYGTDVYIAGYDEGSRAAPVYWKNGVKYHLPSGGETQIKKKMFYG